MVSDDGERGGGPIRMTLFCASEMQEADGNSKLK